MTMAVRSNVCWKILNPSVLFRTSVAVRLNVCVKTLNPSCFPSRVSMAMPGSRIVNHGVAKMKVMWPSMLRLSTENEPAAVCWGSKAAGSMMGVARCCSGTGIEGSAEEGHKQKLGILWDLKSCGDTKSLSHLSHEEAAVAMAHNVLAELWGKLPLNEPITTFIAYGDPSNFPQCSNFNIIIDENTSVRFEIVAEKHSSVKADWVEKAIITDMFMFALNNPPPSKLVVLSDKGDIILPATYELVNRDYLVIHSVFKLK